MNIEDMLYQLDTARKWCYDNPEADAVEEAIELLREAHKAGFITDDGKARKVVGKLEYTEEGSIISRGGSVWIHQPSNGGVLVREWVHSLIGEKAWDTREAAEAARGEK